MRQNSWKLLKGLGKKKWWTNEILGDAQQKHEKRTGRQKNEEGKNTSPKGKKRYTTLSYETDGTIQKRLEQKRHQRRKPKNLPMSTRQNKQTNKQKKATQTFKKLIKSANSN